MSTRDTFYAIGATVFCDRRGLVKHFPLPYAPPFSGRGGPTYMDTMRQAEALARALNGIGPRAERARVEAGL